MTIDPVQGKKKDTYTHEDLKAIIRPLEERLTMEREMRENLEHAIDEITEHLFASLEELSSRSKMLQNRNLELEIQDKIVKIINQEISLESVLKTLLQQALYLFPHGEKGAFLQYDPRSERFVFSAVQGYDAKSLEQNSISYKKWVKMITKNSQELDDGILIVKGFDSGISPEILHGKLSHSMLAMALNLDRKLDDFLILDNTKDPQMFEPSDIQNLLRFREHAISAISKAKILDLLQEEKKKTDKALEHARQTNKKLEKARQELEEMSFTDPLTKLHNRRFLTTFIQKEFSKTIRYYRQKNTNGASPAAKAAIGFAMLDIDHFKHVNDTFGHDSGDLVLKQVAHILNKNCRESDIIIRWGGEEFLIICLNINAEEVQFLSDRIKTAIEKQVFVIANEKSLNQTCSIGFACYPFISSDIKALNYEQMIAIADKCLYVAKASGRNTWVGVSGTKKTSRKDIPSILNSQFNTLIQKGLLDICTSLPDVNSLSVLQA